MSTLLSFSLPVEGTFSGLTPFPLDPGIETLDQASSLLPEGAYTTFRTYPGLKALHIEDHFNRLEKSSILGGHSLKLNRTSLRQAIREALSNYPAQVARVRLLIPFVQGDKRIYIFIGALSVPGDNDRRQGVRVITRHLSRNNPSAKLTGFIQATKHIREQFPGGIEEIVMVDTKRRLLEGLTSNFYVVADGELWTAGDKVLSGITRQMVLELAGDAGITVNLTAPCLDNIDKFEEAFITSTSRAVLPVTEIDGQSVGQGFPGSITTKLMALYDQRVQSEIESI